MRSRSVKTCEEFGRRYGLSRRGALALMLLARGLLYLREFAVVFQVGRSLIFAELIRLTDAGLVEAVKVNDDGRCTDSR